MQLVLFVHQKYLKTLILFSKFSLKDFSLYMNPYYGTKIDHKINIKDLYKVYKKSITYNLGKEGNEFVN